MTEIPYPICDSTPAPKNSIATSTSPSIRSFTDHIKNTGLNYDFIEYDNPGLPPLYAIEKSGLQEYFGEKRGLTNEKAGSEQEAFLSHDKHHLSIWSFTDHIKSKGFNYVFIEYGDPGGPVTRQERTDQNQMQPMHISPSSQGSQLDHYSGQYHTASSSPRIWGSTGLLPSPAMPIHPTFLTSDKDHHSNETVPRFGSGATGGLDTEVSMISTEA